MKKELTGWTQTSVEYYHSSLRKIQEERRSQYRNVLTTGHVMIIKFTRGSGYSSRAVGYDMIRNTLWEKVWQLYSNGLHVLSNCVVDTPLWRRWSNTARTNLLLRGISKLSETVLIISCIPLNIRQTQNMFQKLENIYKSELNTNMQTSGSCDRASLT